MVSRRIPHPNDPRLGRHINHDPRSLRYLYRAPRKALVSVRHEAHMPILDQGYLGSCTGNAGVGAMGRGSFFPTITEADKYQLDEDGAIQLYSDATKIDPFPGTYPPDDTGSDGLSVAKALTSAGEIAGYEHAFDLDTALQALQDRPVITGVYWYDNMYHPDADGIVSIGGDIAGGHEFVVDEYNAERQLVGCSNSWGSGFGLDGRFYMKPQTWATLLNQDGDVTIFSPAGVDPPTPTPDPPGCWGRATRWLLGDGFWR